MILHALANSGGEVENVLFDALNTVLNIVRRVFKARSQTVNLQKANSFESPDVGNGVRCRDVRKAKDSIPL